MAVETRGTVQMKGDAGPGIGVNVFVDDVRMRLVSGNELIGEWEHSNVGVHALNDGFSIRAEGEEFILRTESDAAVAESLGLLASTPRMARKVAASHPPEDRAADEAEVETKSYLLPIVFALGGVLVLAGGMLINADSSTTVAQLDGDPDVSGGGEFWLAFVVGGGLMAIVAFILSLGTRFARVIALLVLAGIVVVFALAARNAALDANQLLAYGFIAGGIVVGVAVVFSDSLRGGDDSG